MNKLILLTIIIFFNIISTSCKKREVISDNNHLKMSISSRIDSVDPAISYDSVSATVVYQVYEQLYQYSYLKRPYEVEPLLAEALPLISKDQRTIKIKIKKNVRYHDDPSLVPGRTLKAEDFITQIKRLAFISTRSTGSWLFEGIIEGFDEFKKEVGSNFELFKTKEIKGLRAIDDHTLELKLTRPYPQLKYVLSMSFTSPIPMESVVYYKNMLDQSMVGTGPFYLSQWIKSSKITLEKFRNYRNEFYPSSGDNYSHQNNLLKDQGRKIPFLDKITMNVIKEDQTRWLNFMAKKIDYISIPKDNFAMALDVSGNLSNELKEKGMDIQITPTQTYWWLAFNMENPILGKNKNLRLAIAHAIDRDRMIKLFTNNRALKSNTIFPPSVFGYNPNKKVAFEYNLEKAKSFLAKAGFPGGKGLPIIKFNTRGVNATWRQRAEFIKSELKKVNINVEIQMNNFPAYLEKARKGDLEFYIDGWAMDYPDAENSLQLLFSKNVPPGPNSSYYSSEKFDQLFNRIKVLPDNKEKQALLDTSHDLIQEDFPWAMLYYSRDYILHSKRLKNFRHSSSINNFMKYIKK